jgi:VCBS repeat-containing protein
MARVNQPKDCPGEFATKEEVGSVTVNPDGSFTYVPTADIRHAAAAVNASDAVKADSFGVTVSDGYGGTASARVDVAVSPAGGNPAGGTITDLQVDDIIGVITGSISGVTDPDSDSLTYTVNPTSAGGGYIDVFSDGSFTYNPTVERRHLAAAVGAPFTTTHDSFAVFVADGHGDDSAITVVVPIPTESDEPPTGERCDAQSQDTAHRRPTVGLICRVNSLR